ncbi:hypothetical protein JCM18750_23830 [Halostagnicola bangensis]
MGDLLRQVRNNGLSAEILYSFDLILAPDHTSHVVVAFGQNARDVLSDLSVGSRDEYVHILLSEIATGIAF